MKREAVETMIQPVDLTMVLLSGMLAQVLTINGVTISVEEKVKMKNWVCPRPEYLAMCAVKEYE